MSTLAPALDSLNSQSQKVSWLPSSQICFPARSQAKLPTLCVGDKLGMEIHLTSGVDKLPEMSTSPMLLCMPQASILEISVLTWVGDRGLGAEVASGL